MTGRLQCPLSNGMTILAQPTMEEHGMTGSALARVDADFRMVDLEIYFDQQQPMASMVKIGRLPGASPKGTPSAPAAPLAGAQASSASFGQLPRPDSRPASPPPSPQSVRNSSALKGSMNGESGALRGLAKGFRGLFTRESSQGE